MTSIQTQPNAQHKSAGRGRQMSSFVCGPAKYGKQSKIRLRLLCQRRRAAQDCARARKRERERKYAHPRTHANTHLQATLYINCPFEFPSNRHCTLWAQNWRRHAGENDGNDDATHNIVPAQRVFLYIQQGWRIQHVLNCVVIVVNTMRQFVNSLCTIKCVCWVAHGEG